MEGDPYVSLVKTLKPAATRGLTAYTGKILKTSPLTVSAAGINISGTMLKVSSDLKPHSVTVTAPSGTLGISASCAWGAHSSMGVNSGTLTATVSAPLAVGDEVLLISSDDQTFYLICKVVTA